MDTREALSSEAPLCGVLQGSRFTPENLAHLSARAPSTRASFPASFHQPGLSGTHVLSGAANLISGIDF